MTPGQLENRYRDVLRRYARALSDSDGEPPAGLLSELRRIADAQAADAVNATLAAARRRQPSAKGA